MMEENFRRIADAVRLPEGSRARIRAQIASRAEEQEASMQSKPKKHLPRLAVAAIIIAAALTLTAAAAAVVHRFRNDIIVSSVSELPAPTEDTPTAVAVVTDSQSAAQTLDEILAEGPYITAEEWETGEKIGGTTSAQYGGWDTAELISSDPALSVRRITRETDGAEKMQYMAEDPADLRNITPYYHNHQRVSDLHGVDDEILKIAILHHGGTAEHIYPRFAPYRADFSIAVSAFEWMDIMPKGVNKGVGVRMLQKHLGITREETMAFGDFMNDLEMLQEAGYSVAMKNALPQIKAVCREETAYTNEEDGVIRWIRQWLKKGIE